MEFDFSGHIRFSYPKEQSLKVGKSSQKHYYKRGIFVR
jgi:hypothetical protein